MDGAPVLQPIASSLSKSLCTNASALARPHLMQLFNSQVVEFDMIKGTLTYNNRHIHSTEACGYKEGLGVI